MIAFMPDYTPEKLEAYAIRRFDTLAHGREEPYGVTYEAIFGADPMAEDLGKKLMKREKVKETYNEMIGRLKDWSVANVGQTAVLADTNIKEFLIQALMSTPNDASMDSPLCDVKVLKDGSKIPVLPEKSNLLQLAARVLKLVGPDVNVQMNLPSWEPSPALEGQKSWVLPEELPQLTETSSIPR